MTHIAAAWTHPLRAGTADWRLALRNHLTRPALPRLHLGRMWRALRGQNCPTRPLVRPGAARLGLTWATEEPKRGHNWRALPGLHCPTGPHLPHWAGEMFRALRGQWAPHGMQTIKFFGHLHFNVIVLRAAARGTWCSGITSASHAEGPGFNPQCVQWKCCGLAVVTCWCLGNCNGR